MLKSSPIHRTLRMHDTEDYEILLTSYFWPDREYAVDVLGVHVLHSSHARTRADI